MSAAFIRKTPNYPLLHTVFHLLQGKQRPLIRKAALSAISLAGGGGGGAGSRGKRQRHPWHHCAGSPRGAAGLSETQAPLCPLPQAAD